MTVVPKIVARHNWKEALGQWSKDHSLVVAKLEISKKAGATDLELYKAGQEIEASLERHKGMLIKQKQQQRSREYALSGKKRQRLVTKLLLLLCCETLSWRRRKES